MNLKLNFLYLITFWIVFLKKFSATSLISNNSFSKLTYQKLLILSFFHELLSRSILLLQEIATGGVPTKKARTCNFIKKEVLAQLFSCDFCEIFKTFWQNTPHITTSVLLYFYYNQKDQKEKPRSFISFDFFVKIGPSQKFGMVLNMDL